MESEADATRMYKGYRCLQVLVCAFLAWFRNSEEKDKRATGLFSLVAHIALAADFEPPFLECVLSVKQFVQDHTAWFLMTKCHGRWREGNHLTEWTAELPTLLLSRWIGCLILLRYWSETSVFSIQAVMVQHGSIHSPSPTHTLSAANL